MTYSIEDARCIRQTEKAILVDAPELDEPEWIPQSQVDADSEVYKFMDEGVLIVSDWFAEKRGWL